MRSLIFIAAYFFFSLSASAAWVGISSQEVTEASVRVLSQSESELTLFVRIEGFSKESVSIQGETFFKISSPGCTPLLIEGSPDLPKLVVPILVPASGLGDVEVSGTAYQDFTLNVAPSKGNLYRDTDPASVPYRFGEEYIKSGLFPSRLVTAGAPYILRDFTGQSLQLSPFQYDHSNRTLRVYSAFTIRLKAPAGVKWPAVNAVDRLDIDFAGIYSRHFVNYGALNYTPLYDQGRMLVIADSMLMPTMAPFIEWKNRKGQPTEMVSVQAAGLTHNNIRSFVSHDYYTNGLTFLLLVGDHAQVPSFPAASGDSDPSYGYIAGNDAYAEVIVGRLSANDPDELATQVYRTLQYEQFPDTAAQWYSKGICIASDQGPGDDNEMDYEHARNMRQDLIGYSYTDVDELYDGTQGLMDASGNPTASDLQQSINAGRGIILYTGHGSTSGLGTTGFSNADVSGLMNASQLPFMWSVACVNGNFVNNTCLAEVLLRAKDSSDAPTGALATMMSTINQSWDPPMDAQDEMVDILTGAYPSNRRLTFGGISVNGCMHMNDQYGSAGYEMTDTWTCFGDPSIVVRTATPHQLFVQHPMYLDETAMQFQPAVSDDGALVCLSHHGAVIARGWSLLGTAMIPVSGLVAGDTLDVTATSYNTVPYRGIVVVTSGTTGIDKGLSEDVLIYPNPASGSVHFRLSKSVEGDVTCALSDLSGRTVATGSLAYSASNTYRFAFPETASGIYQLEIMTSEMRTVKRLVIR